MCVCLTCRRSWCPVGCQSWSSHCHPEWPDNQQSLCIQHYMEVLLLHSAQKNRNLRKSLRTELRCLHLYILLQISCVFLVYGQTAWFSSLYDSKCCVYMLISVMLLYTVRCCRTSHGLIPGLEQEVKPHLISLHSSSEIQIFLMFSVSLKAFVMYILCFLIY